ncbi:hypothetical protein [Vreelandella titanicae]|uniref:Uncharacterized protein n=1 Tax=Vreelandella titanicae TaxID=664683 RepID=A0A558JD69_9GAMM|nr:hypothetical protein [Halomonas titanicae]TVU91578.1 hypothetical protein FQP89_00125 [Halomonas titanicae]
MTDLTPITYAETAHTSEKFLWPRSEPCHHGKRFRLSAASGKRLTYRNPSEAFFPTRELQRMSLSDYRKFTKHKDFTPRPSDRPKHPLRWDEECLRYTSQNKINFIIGVIRATGFIGLIWMMPVCILGISFMSFSYVNSQPTLNFWPDFFSYSGWDIAFFVLAFSIIAWGGANLLYRFFPEYTSGYQPGPMWELNRRTGMVKVFSNPAKKNTAWKVAHELPFHEFDCYIQSSPTSQGIVQYNLSLVHYSVEAHVALVGMLGVTSRLDQLAAWDMLQRFMDTSQPLPDSPQWEDFRPLDPTTLEWDKETGRPPRYWRDMDDETFNQKIVELQDRLSAFYYG